MGLVLLANVVSAGAAIWRAYEAHDANKIARKANEYAKDTNDIAKYSNDIADRANVYC
jgi:hypothetical protein